MNPKVQDEVPISIYDLNTEIKNIKKRDKELSLRTAKTEEYLHHCVVLKQNEAKELEKSLNALKIPRLKDMHVKKILDILPASLEELKVTLQGYTLTVSKDNMEKIVSVVKKFLPDS